jgi:hypothetical protein
VKRLKGQDERGGTIGEKGQERLLLAIGTTRCKQLFFVFKGFEKAAPPHGVDLLPEASAWCQYDSNEFCTCM